MKSLELLGWRERWGWQALLLGAKAEILWRLLELRKTMVQVVLSAVELLRLVTMGRVNETRSCEGVVAWLELVEDVEKVWFGRRHHRVWSLIGLLHGHEACVHAHRRRHSLDERRGCLKVTGLHLLLLWVHHHA